MNDKNKKILNTAGVAMLLFPMANQIALGATTYIGDITKEDSEKLNQSYITQELGPLKQSRGLWSLANLGNQNTSAIGKNTFLYPTETQETQVKTIKDLAKSNSKITAIEDKNDTTNGYDEFYNQILGHKQGVIFDNPEAQPEWSGNWKEDPAYPGKENFKILTSSSGSDTLTIKDAGLAFDIEKNMFRRVDFKMTINYFDSFSEFDPEDETWSVIKANVANGKVAITGQRTDEAEISTEYTYAKGEEDEGKKVTEPVYYIWDDIDMSASLGFKESQLQQLYGYYSDTLENYTYNGVIDYSLKQGQEPGNTSKGLPGDRDFGTVISTDGTYSEGDRTPQVLKYMEKNGYLTVFDSYNMNQNSTDDRKDATISPTNRSSAVMTKSNASLDFTMNFAQTYEGLKTAGRSAVINLKPVSPQSPLIISEKSVTDSSDSDTKASPGETLNYKINLENLGNLEATNVKVQDTLKDSNFDLSTLSKATVTGAKNVVGDDITKGITMDIPENGKVTISFSVKVKALSDGTYSSSTTTVNNQALVESEYCATPEACEPEAIIPKVPVGKISLNKVEDDSAVINGDTTNNPLANAEFTVKDNSNKVVDTLLTDTKGNATTKNLVAGEYTVTETKAPTNYVNNGFNEKVTIDQNGEVIKLNAGKGIENNIIKGKVTLKKVENDSLAINGDTTNNPLEKAEFTITDNKGKEVQTITTDEKGSATSAYLAPGKYSVKETKAPSGYILDEKVYDFEISKNGETINLNNGESIINNINTGSIELTKVENDITAVNGDDKNNPLPNAEFTITDTNGKVVEKITTDEKGNAKSSQLKDGKYTITETKAPEGYVNSQFKEDFIIDEDKEVIQINEGKDIENKSITGKVELTKIGDLGTGAKDVVDTDEKSAYEYDLNKDGEIQDTEKVEYPFTTKKVSGAEFTITDSDGNEVETIITDEDGNASSLDLKFGKYTITETKAPTGYSLDSTVYSFEITEDGQVAEINNGLPVLNTRNQGYLDLTKVSNTTEINPEQEKLANAEFEILKDSNANGLVDEGEEKNIVETIVTDEEGYAKSSSLTTGAYLVHEIKAPTGYDVNTNIFPVVVTADETAHVNEGEAIVNNHKQQKIQVIKHDEKGNTIEGVKFEIYNESGDVIDTITTDENGVAESRLLDYGKYTMKETEAPKEYIFDPNQIYNFEINDVTEAEQFKVIVTNDLIEGQIQVEKVDKKDGTYLSGAEFIVTNKETGEIVDNLKTGTDGKATSEILPYGTYIITETKAPEGYNLDSEPQEVTIGAKENDTTQNEVFFNTEETEEVCTGLDDNNKEIIETVDKSEVESKKGDCEIPEAPKKETIIKEVNKTETKTVIKEMPETSAGIKEFFKNLFNL